MTLPGIPGVDEFPLFLHESQAEGMFGSGFHGTTIAFGYTWSPDSLAGGGEGWDATIPSWMELAGSDIDFPMAENVLLKERGVYIVTACVYTRIVLDPPHADGVRLKARHLINVVPPGGGLV
jgi:hypothetical protein